MSDAVGVPIIASGGAGELAHLADVLDRLGPSPLAEDQLIRDLAATARDVTPVLTELELDGHIARSPGGMLARVM